MIKRLTTEQFIEKANKIHNFKYDYSKTIYIKSNQKIIIICPKHEKFLQTPNAHLRKQGCKKCSVIKIKKILTFTNEQFIQKAKEIHGNQYDYSKVEYKNSHTKIIIVCPKHGQFEQIPDSHIRGSSCFICSRLNSGWSYNSWNNQALQSKNFDSFKVYIIKCWNEDEEFYKIGKTFNKLERRFNNRFTMPYNYKSILIINSKNNSFKISKLENKLHKENCKYKYIPKLKFEGQTECFNQLNIINNILVDKIILKQIISYNKNKLT